MAKRWHNMTADERRGERLRRLPAVVRAIRDMNRDDIVELFAAAMLIDGDPRGVVELMKVRLPNG
jgi:hypothetical protein